MAEYRTGNHWGVTIVREPHPDATEPCSGSENHPGHDLCAKLVAVVVNGDQALAERICALLNEQGDEKRCTARGEFGPTGGLRAYTCRRKAHSDINHEWVLEPRP